MDQKEINQAEWEKAENWGGPDWGAVYFSKKDNRICVRKKVKWMGWTVNLAHSPGVFTFVGVLFGIPMLVILILVLFGVK